MATRRTRCSSSSSTSSPPTGARACGAALHAACVEQWRADGIREAGLDVHRENRRAQAFYARHGWRPAERAHGGGTHLRMRLTVSDAAGE